jgi:acyl-CoA synthetase (AMP-forming)/AMP-acid ligase II
MNAPVKNSSVVKQPSIYDVINQCAMDKPEGKFLIDPISGETINSAHALKRIQSIAANIANQGIAKGDSVAFAFSNSVDAALTILGIMYGGYLAVSINLVAGDAVISYVLEHSETKLIIADEAAKKQVQPLAKTCPSPAKILELKDISSDVQALDTLEECGNDLDGLLMYTSGTTGRPKGVVLTHTNLLAGGRNTTAAHELTSEDCGLCVLPLYHINAVCVSLMGALVSGSSIVIPPKFSVSAFWDTIRAYQCSWFSVVPTQISYLLHNAENIGGDATGCERLRFGRSASAPLSPDMHSAFEKRFEIPIIETMGLTETAAQILSNPLPPGVRKIGSPGIGFGNEVIIADKAQREVIRNVEGEVLVRGPNVMRCYLKNEDATKEAITKDGWLRTGDLGKQDEEGYVYITGRLKELIIKGGENIAPREVDEALYSHPDVVEAAAFALDCPNYGQRIEAGVMVSEGSSLNEAQLIEICVNQLGKFKTPDRIHFFPELPKGPSGKIQRIKIAELITK